jgi:DNA-binding LacI/PurR family transcriptional regulator
MPKNKKRTRTTITDVAERAGVSLATVSRVVNTPDIVTEPTRLKVQEAIDELGYWPNSVARGLSLGRSSLMAVIAPSPDTPSVSERLHGVAARLSTSGYDLALFDVDDVDDRDRVFEELSSSQRMAAMMLISLKPTRRHLKSFGDLADSLVVVDAYVPEVSCISIDNVEGGRLAARHLLALGHRRVAFVGGDEKNLLGFTSSRDRRIGFEEVLGEAGISLGSDYLAMGPHGGEPASDAAQRLLSLPEPPSGIFAASDTHAQGILGVARARGVDVPRRLSIIGFDDIKSAAALELTTIRQPLEESGRLAAELMIEYVEERSQEALKVDLRLPIEFVERRTTAPLAS